MPVVVLAALILAVSAVTFPSAAPAQPCAIEDNARPHRGLMPEMTRPDDPQQTPPIDCWTLIEPAQSPAVARLGTAQLATAGRVERTAEPGGMPRAVLLVVIAIVVTIGIIEVLFRCTIHERPRSADHRQTE
ncbi:MAG TPA: hypothetical protein VKS24_18250 [Bradyrhizobium sp.]|nr:hypothetical protein [Bradyrhizobium sp.]